MKKYFILLFTMLLMTSLVSCTKSKKITLSYDESKIEVFVGDELSVKPKVELGKKAKEYELSYELSTNIATVDKEGRFVAKEAGTVTVTVTANDKNKTSASIDVKILDKEYEALLDAMGGIVDVTTIQYKNNEIVKLPVPTKEGCVFLGWYQDDQKVEEVTGKNYTLVAKWDTVDYTITLNADGGKVENTTITFEHGNIPTLPVPTKEGYKFLGWYEGEVQVEVLENKNYELVAKWEIVKYTVSLNADGGELENTTITFEHGNIPTLPVPTKEGYKFLGWYEKDVKVEKVENKNYELVAKWEIVKYTVSLNADGGELENTTITFEHGNIPTLPVPTKEGYKFLGWYEGEVQVEVLENKNYELVAKWEIVKYTVSLNADGGELENTTITFEHGNIPTLPVPTKEGYKFLGWYEKDVKVEKVENKNYSLVAKWEIVKYTVSLNADGGELENTTITFEHGNITTLPVPIKEGYKFLGWYEKDVKVEKVDNKNYELVAKWEKQSDPEDGDQFTINYELNGGSWTWTVASVTTPAKGIDAVSNLPEIFMADFYAYLFENNLLASDKVAAKLRVNDWSGFSAKYGDPVAWYNATSTGGYSAADGYSELFYDSVNGYEAVGGFLGTSPYKEKYANLTKHAIQLTMARYSIDTTKNYFKGALGFVLDGYFYGTQGLLAATKANAETFNALRAVIPTPTVGYEGTTSSTNEYVISNGVIGTPVKLVAPVKEGHMFLGWFTNPELTGDKVTYVSSGCTLYAAWYDLNAPAPKYQINYVLDGGTNSSDAPKEFTFGEGVALTKPTKAGYTFVGWSTDEAGINLITEISPLQNADITIYANWIEGEEKIYSITYIYNEGKLPTYNPTTIQEVAEYVFTSYYNWLKPTDSYETFKTKVIAQWKDSQSQGNYKFYKQNGKDTIDESYFCNATENFEEWNAWFTVFDSLVTAANGAQNAWNSYVGILRLGQVLSGNAPTTWKDNFNTTLCNATHIAIPLVTEYELGDEFELIDLVINDGRTFLGWYDSNGNKVEKIYSNTQGNLVLTAKWSEAIPVETFEVTNAVDRLLKLSEYQLSWTIGPENATLKKVTFESTNPEVLTVSEKGLIEAVGIGTAKVLITVHANTSLNMELEIEVYVDPYIDGEYLEETYVVYNETTQLSATVVGGPSNNIIWESKTPNIATVTNDGVVTGAKEGLAEIVAKCADDENISFTFYVTVLDSAPTGILKLLLESNNKEVYTTNDLLIGIKIGSDGAYYADIVGSVSKLLFEDYVVYDDYYLANPSNKSTLNGDGKGGIDFITVHYAADMPYAASATFNGGKNLASYNKSCNTNGTQASWHYSVGNDGIWACQSESYGAWHAGASKKMTWTDSGVTTAQVGTDIYPTDVTMGSDGYFYIKGVKTSIKNTSAGTKLNGMGLGVKLVGTKVYLGGHYQNTSYNYISSTGGNNNSIGMETSVREGSDLWLTWQFTAQLCAKLLLKYELPLNRLVGHHFFSGKWCPQPMLENNLEIWHEFVELTRQQMDLYENYNNYSLSFASSSSYLKDNGRVSKLPDYPECVTYTVTYTTGSSTKTITLPSILPGVLE